MLMLNAHFINAQNAFIEFILSDQNINHFHHFSSYNKKINDITERWWVPKIYSEEGAY